MCLSTDLRDICRIPYARQGLWMSQDLLWSRPAACLPNLLHHQTIPTEVRADWFLWRNCLSHFLTVKQWKNIEGLRLPLHCFTQKNAFSAFQCLTGCSLHQTPGDATHLQSTIPQPATWCIQEMSSMESSRTWNPWSSWSFQNVQNNFINFIPLDPPGRSKALPIMVLALLRRADRGPGRPGRPGPPGMLHSAGPATSTQPTQVKS